MAKNLVGKTLGGYKLTEVIGEGGMATVYMANQVSLNRQVAVKVLHFHESNSLARFELEAKAIASLRHRNILMVYEYGDEQKTPYIAMEYVPGGTLEDRLTGQPMSWRRVIGLMIPIAQALHFAHSQGIIHRDVKPSNILMPQDDWPVLADFGLVKHSGDEKGLTLAGTFLGTPSYIAPEQARDVPLDARADMYSLGVVMFEMITGRVPFDYEAPNRILLAHVKDSPPAPRDLNPDCPPALEEVILRSLKKTPAERYSDMQELADALRAILAAAPPANEAPAGTVRLPSAPEPDVIEEEAASGSWGRFFSPIKKLFGKTAAEDEIHKTVPQPQLDMSATELEDDEWADQTVRLKPDAGTPRQIPRLYLPDKKAALNLPPGDSLILGRSYRGSNVDLDLEPYDASKLGVSRRHARLVNKGGMWLLEDLQSLNGTFVNNKKIPQRQPIVIKDGDTIRLSNLTVVFMLR